MFCPVVEAAEGSIAYYYHGYSADHGTDHGEPQQALSLLFTLQFDILKFSHGVLLRLVEAVYDHDDQCCYCGQDHCQA